MRVQHNITAMNSYRNYNNNTRTINKNIEKLSSGYKINRAGDDAAGLAISEKMRAQITGLEGAQKNAKDGISLVQTAEGALTEIHSMLNRMYSLAEQSANGTYDNGTDRSNLQKEVSDLKNEINRIADSANFNGIKLLNGTTGSRTVAFDFTTDDGHVANGVQSAQVYGGGNASVTAATTATFSVATAAGDTENGVKVTLTASSAINGIEWVAVNSTNGSDNIPSGTANTTADATLKGRGGSVVFRAVRANDTSTAIEDDLAYYEGMEIVVNIDGPDKDGNYAAGTVADIDFGTASDMLQLQIGDTADSYNQLKINIKDMHTNGSMNIDNVSVGTADEAATAMGKLKSAIDMVSSVRGDLGAKQNRLEHTINNLSVMQENIQDAESTIRDTDVADEMMKYTKNSILVQSAQAMLAQANQQPQGVLQLLQ